MEDLHHSANIFLGYFHYFRGDIDLLTVDWKERHKTRLAHLNPREIGFFYHTTNLLKDKERGELLLYLSRHLAFWRS
jgi:hypothetical protein